MPRRGFKEGVLRREDDFHGMGVNRIDSCLFLQCLFSRYKVSMENRKNSEVCISFP